MNENCKNCKEAKQLSKNPKSKCLKHIQKMFKKYEPDYSYKHPNT